MGVPGNKINYIIKKLKIKKNDDIIKKLTDINRCLTDPTNHCLTDV